jgi:hypothetical protein
MQQIEVDTEASSAISQSLEHELDKTPLVEIATIILHRLRVILGALALGFIFGAAASLISSRKYVAGTTFIPQLSASDASGAGGLALAASQFGIRMPTGGAGWGAPVYVEVVRSRSVLGPIALDSVTIDEEGGRRTSVAELFKIDDRDEASRLEKTIRKLRTIVDATENKKLGAVRVTVTTKWPSVSFALVKRLLIDVNKFNLITRQSQAGAERRFAEIQAREAERALRLAEERMQKFLEQNRVVVSPALLYQRERIQRDITIRQLTYTSLLQNFSEARLREVRNTPVITVLEGPVLPAIGEPRNTAMTAAIGSIAAGLLAVIVVVIQNVQKTATGDVRRSSSAMAEQSLSRQRKSKVVAE